MKELRPAADGVIKTEAHAVTVKPVSDSVVLSSIKEKYLRNTAYAWL